VLSVVANVATGMFSEGGIGLKVGFGSDTGTDSDIVIDCDAGIATKSTDAVIMDSIASATPTISSLFF
jgi:hypothetical protein